MTRKTHILFICLGNICRSPTAEGVFRSKVEEAGLADRFVIDSAGTGAWHVGNEPDRRMQAAARGRGIDLSNQQARCVERRDFDDFDLLIAMDRSNYRALQREATPGNEHKIKLFMEYAPETGISEVPDPYYGGPQGFETVLDLVDTAALGLLDSLQSCSDESGKTSSTT